MAKNDGGNAFPANEGGFSGMTMRQYYKAAALQGLVAGLHEEFKVMMMGKDGEQRMLVMAKNIGITAGSWADAMIAEDLEAAKS
jgi:hypothetical protein